MFKLWLLLGCFSSKLLLGMTGNELQPQCFTVEDLGCPNSNVSFWLYTNEHPNGRFLDPADLKRTPLDQLPLKVLIHSLNGNRDATPNLEVRPELLHIPNINIISVDYANLTPDPCYIESVHNIRLVARCLAEFLLDLISLNFVKAEQIHLIGYGLGAHAAAFTANKMVEMNTKITHITALDPSKAMFLTPELADRIDPSDATFVDVIHTDIFIHGLLQPVGHVDFYPNKGVIQPNCGPVDDIGTHDCFQKRAADYYAESIFSPTKFWAFKCNDLYRFLKGDCHPGDDIEELGYHTRLMAKGNYFLSTNEQAPYARGNDFEDIDRSLLGKSYLPNELLVQMADTLFAKGLTTQI